jgi:uncharacterized membrane-anchored protein
MSFLDSVLKVFVGDKSKQDVKAISPLVDEIKTFESAIEALSHDELRGKTFEFKAKIAEATKDINEQIANLLEEAENTESSGEGLLADAAPAVEEAPQEEAAIDHRIPDEQPSVEQVTVSENDEEVEFERPEWYPEKFWNETEEQ